MELTPELKAQKEREEARGRECPLRVRGGCEDIRGNLGWNHGTDMETCDLCWNQGGPTGGAAFRDDLMRQIIDEMSDIEHLVDMPKDVIEAMLRWHLTPEAAETLRQHPEFSFALHKREMWDRVKGTWHQADSFVRSMMSRGVTNKYVPLTIKEKRHISCFGTTMQGEKVGTVCRSLQKSREGDRHYCGACGCGDRANARLDETPYGKLDYPYLECPRQRPGFSNER